MIFRISQNFHAIKKHVSLIIKRENVPRNTFPMQILTESRKIPETQHENRNTQNRKTRRKEKNTMKNYTNSTTRFYPSLSSMFISLGLRGRLHPPP
jgi:hypothetical protein